MNAGYRSRKKRPTVLPFWNNGKSDSTPQRVRRLMEPLVMSLVTTLLVFFSVSSNSMESILSLDSSSTVLMLRDDAPRYYPAASAAATTTTKIKRRYPDPPPFDFDKHFAWNANAQTHQTPIFFHIYIPSEAPDRALEIVTEQLDQLSYHSSSSSSSSRTDNNESLVLLQGQLEEERTKRTIFYQTVGQTAIRSRNNNLYDDYETIIAELCHDRNLNCHSMGHYQEGREELTLHRVYEFCHADNDDNDDHGIDNNEHDRRIAYIHNKGSHHDSFLNNQWRQTMMNAITHPHCLQPPDDTCNLCSLFLTAERGIFSAGNFWVAKCSYIRQLLPPLDFEGHMERVVKDALYLRLQNTFTMNIHRHWPPSFGTGRFAAEYWSGSHPSIVPCDFSQSFSPRDIHHHNTHPPQDNTNDFLKWVNSSTTTTTTTTTLNWTMAPKHPIKLLNKNIRRSEHLRLPEYFLLAGNVFRWYELYGHVPDDNSWVWAWFPDGRKWRNAIQIHGKKALQELTQFRRNADES